jgi:RNA polymerase sigma factor (TIGR02999 family)
LLLELYDELRRLAEQKMARENSPQTLQATALVHEVWLRLGEGRQVGWQNRAHFFAISAQLMRQILVDFARAAHSLKRGGDVLQVSLDEALVLTNEREGSLVAIDEALKILAKVDPRKSKVVELRYFGGLSVEETAEVLNVSCDTVKRDWRLAKAWMLREISEKGKDS